MQGLPLATVKLLHKPSGNTYIFNQIDYAEGRIPGGPSINNPDWELVTEAHNNSTDEGDAEAKAQREVAQRVEDKNKGETPNVTTDSPKPVDPPKPAEPAKK